MSVVLSASIKLFCWLRFNWLKTNGALWVFDFNNIPDALPTGVGLNRFKPLKMLCKEVRNTNWILLCLLLCSFIFHVLNRFDNQSRFQCLRQVNNSWNKKTLTTSIMYCLLGSTFSEYPGKYLSTFSLSLNLYILIHIFLVENSEYCGGLNTFCTLDKGSKYLVSLKTSAMNYLFMSLSGGQYSFILLHKKSRKTFLFGMCLRNY